MYKPFNIIDLTASQLTNTPSIDGTIEELEGVLNRRLTLPEAQVNMILRIIHLAAFLLSISLVSNRPTNRFNGKRI
jgi:hypothetical protein